MARPYRQAGADAGCDPSGHIAYLRECVDSCERLKQVDDRSLAHLHLMTLLRAVGCNYVPKPLVAVAAYFVADTLKIPRDALLGGEKSGIRPSWRS